MQREPRKRRLTRPFDEIQAQKEQPKKKRTKLDKKRPNTEPWKPISLQPSPEVKSLIKEDNIPEYKPLIRVEFQPFERQLIDHNPLRLFMQYFGEKNLDIIVKSTNAKVPFDLKRYRKKYLMKGIEIHDFRLWRDVTRGEVLQYLGLRFYIITSIEIRRNDY